MKFLVTILLFFCLNASATNYYVSNAGSNSNSGLTTSSTWATNVKVNSFSFASGDSILYKGGDVFTTQLIPPRSDIHFASYGTGKATITGLQSISSFTDSSHFWYASIPASVANQNDIIINGVPVAKGRYPNTTLFGSYPSTYTQLTISAQALPDTYVGAELVVVTQAWCVDHVKITAQSGTAINSTIDLAAPLTYNSTNKYFFIQNSLKVLDQTNEWYYDSANKKLYVYSITEPQNVQYSTLDTVVSCHNISNVTFNNLTLSGGNKATFSADTNRNIFITDCTINYSGANGINLNKSHQTTLQSDSILNSWNNGVYTGRQSDTCSFTYNVFKNSGIKAGMNTNGTAGSEHVFAYGLKQTISNNVMDSSGYNGMEWWGANTLVENNLIRYFCFNKADGGGIYTVPQVLSQTGSVVRNNIIGYGIGTTLYGTANGTAGGVYLDNLSTGITAYRNTVFNCSAGGIIFNGGSGLTARENTVYANAAYAFHTGNAIAQSSLQVKNNIFYSIYRPTSVIFFGVVNGTTISDSNYVLKANDADTLFRDGNNLYYNFSDWKTYSSQETHSTVAFPLSIVSEAAGTLVYNATAAAAINPLTGSYTDVYGVTYTNSITLQPFTSALLFKKQDAVIPNRLNSNIKLKVRHT